ncbi:MAG TPA: efflux transporter outer membrane subunit [Planctomycetota bacterium]|nr:efflux transporter outer membrane subunit [Planctomycetota bacterium]
MAARTRFLLLLLTLPLAGCMVGPDYEEPKTEAPPAYDQAKQDGVSGDAVVVEWWKEFGDPQLDDLIKRAVAENRSVRAAMAAVREARAFLAESELELLPDGVAGASYTRSKLSEAAAPGIPSDARKVSYWSAGFDAVWEIDLWGRIRRSIEAASAEAEMVEAFRRDVTVTLLAEVAVHYFELRGARHELEVAKKNADNLRESLRLTTARLNAGRGTELDVARANADLNTTLALVPPLEARVAREKNRLAVLLGVSPTGFTLTLPAPSPLDKLPALVATGRPEDLLRRRPDIREAERRLAAATARIGVATADLFPRLSFSGSFGVDAKSASDLFSSGSSRYAFGPNLSWDVLNLASTSARIRAADARADGELARYEESVFTALEETENALVNYGRARARRDALVEGVRAGERAAALADARYRGGADDYLSSLLAQRTVLSLQLQLAESQTNTVTALIALYKALGGGWETFEPGASTP